MPRNWTKVTDRERRSATDVEKAVRDVIEKNIPIRVVAEAYGISKSSLARYVSDAKRATDLSSYHFKPNIGNRRIFNYEQEIVLSEYLKTASRMCSGLSTKKTRILAYQYACALKVTMPPAWNQNQCAGIDWLQGFMDRHKELSIRSSEATSMGRASSSHDISSEISTSSTSNVNLPSTSQGLNVTPQQISPLPKVAKKVTPQQKGRESIKTTDTPEKEHLELKYSEMMKKAVKEIKSEKL